MALTPAEKQRAYRERRKVEQGNEQEVTPVTEPVTDVTEGEPAPVTRPTTIRGLVGAARAGTIELTETEEQAIRNHWGYASSETRTLLQRDEDAFGMTGKRPAPISEDEYVRQNMLLPPLTNSVGADATYEKARARQEAYARWRYNAYLAGEVANL